MIAVQAYHLDFEVPQMFFLSYLQPGQQQGDGMFKKILVLMMTLTLFTVQANAASGNNLKAAFDDLNYALTVEWDQTDRGFYNHQMQNFALTVKELQAQGLTNQELIDFTVSQIKDQQLAKDLRTAFSVIMINKMSPEEAHQYVITTMNQSYSRGASWAGEVLIGAVALVLLVAIAAIVAGKARVEDGCYKVYTCDEDCFGGICYEECDYRCI